MIEKKVELGDGEPSPPPAKGTVPSTIDGIAEWREKYYLTHRIHDAVIDEELFECLMLQAYASQFTGANFLEFRSGAAQEVSPPIPEPSIEALKAERIAYRAKIAEEIGGDQSQPNVLEIRKLRERAEKAEGDTRELKAALREICKNAPEKKDFEIGGKFDYDTNCGNADDSQAKGEALEHYRLAEIARKVLVDEGL